MAGIDEVRGWRGKVVKEGREVEEEEERTREEESPIFQQPIPIYKRYSDLHRESPLPHIEGLAQPTQPCVPFDTSEPKMQNVISKEKWSSIQSIPGCTISPILFAVGIKVITRSSRNHGKGVKLVP